MTEEISLVPIKDVKPLTDIVEIMTHLSNGDVLRVKQENQGDILLRLSTGKHKFTEVSRDLEKETTFYKRYWVLYNVSINSLLTFDVYLEDDYMESTKVKFPKNTIVEYIRDNQEPDVAKVKDILVDNNGNYFYALSGETALYNEDKLNKIKN
ncbi:hypothetical protein qdsa001_177 [Staphylococcus phage qdsa001]|nr:hypothetical protein qdsa001_177 [Staphylococcus phage qdsa001]QXV86191.1 hypothetical protein [Staphylococcus phage SAPYZU_15]UGL60787.1 hypothetical protein [Staphylococcus phage vB_SauM-HM01]UVD42360.1 hypothetical protein [Staphylococcus phage vB_SauM-V1SA19]WBF47872.1 hypothetical protein SSP49_47 [Staphylococcus phage SSP49]BBM81351.1 hypothetical protein [Staphylococcus phage KSAP7]BBM81539.1 hypothetical protein [Staphylococcus phage KSAP11]